MMGVAKALVMVIFLSGFAGGIVPLKVPMQYEQFCNDHMVADNGAINISTSMLDKLIDMKCLERVYLVYSHVAQKVETDNELDNETKLYNLNLLGSSTTTHSGHFPLEAKKYLRSKEFYGGIGASVKECLGVQLWLPSICSAPSCRRY